MWFDAWLSNTSLCLLVDDIEPDEILWRVAGIIDDTGQWDIHCIRTLIPPRIINQILGYPRQRCVHAIDAHSWKGSSDGIATARSLYQYLSAINNNP